MRALLPLLCLLAGAAARAQGPVPEVPIAPAGPAAPSSSAQRVYERAAGALAQIRVLLSGVRSKTSTGSGFFVSADGLILTNYHVVSALALEPDRYAAEYLGADGSSGSLALVALDAAHDLALLRAEGRGGATLALAPADQRPLQSGERIFALGNPLDLGFALAEGTFNGTIGQHFYEQIFFTGALNPGMSGGPALDEEGRVVGVNVAKRRDGELVSFLVPAARALELLARAAGDAGGEGRDFKAKVTEQLLEHQERVAERLLAGPLPTERLGQYRVPASPGEWVRCWAGRAPDKKAHVSVESHNCSANTSVYVSDRLGIGGISFAHQFLKSPSSLRFLRRHGEGFDGEAIGPGRGGPVRGATLCVEDFVASPPGTLRVVVCSRAYREHLGLYDFVVAAASSDSSRAGLRTRLEVNGFSYENGLRIVRHLLEGIRWDGPAS